MEIKLETGYTAKQLADKCNGPRSSICTVGLYFYCPFIKNCEEITEDDWEELAQNSSIEQTMNQLWDEHKELLEEQKEMNE